MVSTQVVIDWKLGDMITRVNASGAVNSIGNSRTCGGNETFLGNPKAFDPSVAFRGMIGAGEFYGCNYLVNASLRWRIL